MQWSNTPSDHDRKPRDDDDDVDDDVSDYNDVTDYDLPSSVDECRSAVERRQMALTVPQQVKDIASRHGELSQSLRFVEVFHRQST